MHLGTLRLICNGAGLLAWVAFFIQLSGNGHLSVDVTWDTYLVNALVVLVPAALLYFDYRKRYSGMWVHSISSVQWVLFWAFTGIINVASTMSIGGWVGGWESGRWYGYVASMLVVTNIIVILGILLLSVVTIARRPN